MSIIAQRKYKRPFSRLPGRAPTPASTPSKELLRKCRLNGGALWGFDEEVPQRLGAAGHMLHRPVAVLLCILVHPLSHVGGAMLQQ